MCVCGVFLTCEGGGGEFFYVTYAQTWSNHLLLRNIVLILSALLVMIMCLFSLILDHRRFKKKWRYCVDRCLMWTTCWCCTQTSSTHVWQTACWPTLTCWRLFTSWWWSASLSPTLCRYWSSVFLCLSPWSLSMSSLFYCSIVPYLYHGCAATDQ